MAERIIGRSLLPDEVVHHRNGVKDDNAEDNIAVLTRKDHGHLHSGTKESRACGYCGKNTFNIKFCGNACARYRIEWPSDADMLTMKKSGMSTRDMAKHIGGISHVAVWYRLQRI